MTTPANTHQSLARRVALLAVAMLAVVLAVISLTLAFVSASSSRDRIVTAASDKASAVADSIDAFDATARMMTDRAYRPFRKKFAEAFELDVEGGMLKSWGMLLNGDSGEVDAFNQANGGVATIFMRKGDDFERITTSLKKENGERAVGTLLSRDHPAYARMLAGGDFTGRATLFGKPYMTHYEAVKNEAGQVVGILFIGFDITDMQLNLSKLVEEARFYTTGATTVIDPRKDNADAIFVVHPTAAGKKVLEVYPDAGPMLTALRGSPEGFFDGAPKLFSADMTHPWVVKREAKSSGWWVVAELSDDEAMATYWKTIYAFWALLGVATLILGVGLYWLVNRSVSRPLADLTAAVTSVAQGDLTQTFHSDRKDEIGGLVREVENLRQRFQKMLRDMRSAADSINTASAEIATGNQDLSARTEQTASNLQQTASSMEQLTSTVKNSADAARQANQLASSASEIAVRGGQVVGQVVSTMQEIHHSSQKISDIIGVIDGIAFQTNILALNAAVEAARAGEQGRGFAVVAGEVRNLAQRSAEAAKEIKGLIGTSVDRVEAGSRLVADAGQTMSEIVGSIQRVTDIVGEISAAAGEQSDGIGQVNTAVNQLDQMTQQNAALVEESAAAAESLKEQANRLAQAVAVYRIEASSAAPVIAPAPKTENPSAQALTPVKPTPVQRPEPAPVAVKARSTPSSTAVVTGVPVAAATSSSAGGDWESF